MTTTEELIHLALSDTVQKIVRLFEEHQIPSDVARLSCKLFVFCERLLDAGEELTEEKIQTFVESSEPEFSSVMAHAAETLGRLGLLEPAQSKLT